MMEILQMVNYAVWILLGIVIIIGTLFSLYNQHKWTKAFNEVYLREMEDEEA